MIAMIIARRRRRAICNLFSARAQSHAREQAIRVNATVTMRRKAAIGSWAWFMAEATPGGDVVTTTGWCLTERGVDHMQHRAAKQALATFNAAASRDQAPVPTEDQTGP